MSAKPKARKTARGKQSGLRGRVVASATPPKPRGWYAKLCATSPDKAAEFRSLFDEWQDEASEVFGLYPTKHHLARAIAQEFRGVGVHTILRVFADWGA